LSCNDDQKESWFKVVRKKKATEFLDSVAFVMDKLIIY